MHVLPARPPLTARTLTSTAPGMNKWLRIALLVLVVWIALSIVFKILNAVIHLVVFGVIIFLVYSAIKRGGIGRGVR